MRNRWTWVGKLSASLAVIFCLSIIGSADPAAPQAQMQFSPDVTKQNKPAPDDRSPKKDDRNQSSLVLVLDDAKQIKMTFVPIKSGKFMMGSPENEKGRGGDEKLHEVTLTKGYWMQTTELTQGQWEAVMGSNPSGFKGVDLPVEQVGWNDFQEFLKKVNEKYKGQLGERKADLPTEAEWQYACRAGSAGRWCFGDDASKLEEYAWIDVNSKGRTHPVAQKKPNAWGLYDMHGNVWEWTKDWYGAYGGSGVDPQGPSTGGHKVKGGGSWGNTARFSRSSFRGYHGPAEPNYWIGFRVVLR